MLVVYDGSTDGTQEKVESLTKGNGNVSIRLIRNKHEGPAKARNTGIKNARGGIVLLTDADCIPSPTWVQTIVDRMDKGDVVGVAGTYVTLNPEYRIADFIGLDIEYRHLRYGDYTNFAGSYNMGLKKSVLDELGEFDESFKDANAEDNDLSYRISDRGYKIAYAPNAWVKHPHPATLTRFMRQQVKRASWRIFLYKKRLRWVKGDRYAGLETLFQPILLAGLFLVALVALVFNPIWVPLILLLAVLGLIGLNLPFISWVCRKRGAAFAIFASGLIIIRVMSWCTGAVYGTAKFLIVGDAATKVEDMG